MASRNEFSGIDEESYRDGHADGFMDGYAAGLAAAAQHVLERTMSLDPERGRDLATTILRIDGKGA